METFGMSCGGGVGSGLMTEAIDILLMRALDGDAVVGEEEVEVSGLGRMDTRGRSPVESVRLGLIGGGCEILRFGAVVAVVIVA